MNTEQTITGAINFSAGVVLLVLAVYLFNIIKDNHMRFGGSMVATGLSFVMFSNAIRQFYWTPWYFVRATEKYAFVGKWFGDHSYLMIAPLMGIMFGGILIMEPFLIERFKNRWLFVALSIVIGSFLSYVIAAIIVFKL